VKWGWLRYVKAGKFGRGMVCLGKLRLCEARFGTLWQACYVRVRFGSVKYGQPTVIFGRQGEARFVESSFVLVGRVLAGMARHGADEYVRAR